MEYRLLGKVKDINDLQFGALYYFDDTLYVYAGRAIAYGNAHTFLCAFGTYYMNDAGVKALIDNGLMQLAQARKINA